MGAVNAFFGKHDGNVRSRHTRYVGVIVDGSTHFIFDQIQCFSLGTYLFSGNGHPSDSLRGSFHQPIHVRLAGGTDDHDMVCTVPSGHAHSSDVVLKSTRGNFCGNHRHALGVDVAKVFGGRKRHTVL